MNRDALKFSSIILSSILTAILVIYGFYRISASVGSTRADSTVSQPREFPETPEETDEDPIRQIIRNVLPENNDAIVPVRLLFFGDLMLDRHVGEKIRLHGLDNLFENIDSDFFSGYDLVGVNLEGAVTDEGKHYAPVRAYDFSFHPDIIGELQKYNFNFFNLANNHIDDQGIQGVRETADNLSRLGFDYSGCSNGIVSDCSSRIIEAGGLKLGMAGFSALWNQLDEEEAVRTVRTLSSTTDWVIVNIHWGNEYETHSDRRQQVLAHKLIDAGADAIIGHHPHVVQEAEVFNGKPIFYSLGNFIFDQYFSVETQQGLAIELVFDGNKLAYELHPFKSSSSQPELMRDEKKDMFLQKIIPALQ